MHLHRHPSFELLERSIEGGCIEILETCFLSAIKLTGNRERASKTGFETFVFLSIHIHTSHAYRKLLQLDPSTGHKKKDIRFSLHFTRFTIHRENSLHLTIEKNSVHEFCNVISEKGRRIFRAISIRFIYRVENKPNDIIISSRRATFYIFVLIYSTNIII